MAPTPALPIDVPAARLAVSPRAAAAALLLSLVLSVAPAVLLAA